MGMGLGTILSLLSIVTRTLGFSSSESCPEISNSVNMASPNNERTFIMIKPDGVHRGLLGDIIKRFEQKGFKLLAMVWEGLNVVKTGRVMLGETNPKDSAPGTIRGDYCIHVGRNICHGSDAVESAQKEIKLWFKDEELVSWEPASMKWIYED